MVIDLEAKVVRPLARKLLKYGELEDFEQEIRIAVWQARKTWNPNKGASERTYCWNAGMLRVLSIVDSLRRKKRQARLVHFEAPLAGEDSGDLHDVVAGSDPRTAAGAAVDFDRLSESHQETFALMLQGYEQQEVAAILGVDRRTINHRVKFARELLHNGDGRVRKGRPGPSQRQINEAHRLVCDLGMTRRAAAKKLGVDPGTIANWLKKTRQT